MFPAYHSNCPADPSGAHPRTGRSRGVWTARQGSGGERHWTIWAKIRAPMHPHVDATVPQDVLIVDDEETVANVLAAVVAKMGGRVTAARSVDEARELLAEHDFG